MFQNAIVRTPSSTMTQGLTTSAQLGRPDYSLALIQHQSYIAALLQCEVEVTILPSLEHYPDSCFVNDLALITKKMAILTQPSAASRIGEVKEIHSVISPYFRHSLGKIAFPGTLEAGDVLRIENHFYIGLSEQTNEEGAQQLIRQIAQHGYTASVIPLKELRQLKAGVSYLGHGHLLVYGELINHPAFSSFKQIIIDPYESYAVNCIMVNGTILIPQGYPQTKKNLENLDYPLIELDLSEFRKIDGGISCLSLLF